MSATTPRVAAAAKTKTKTKTTTTTTRRRRPEPWAPKPKPRASSSGALMMHHLPPSSSRASRRRAAPPSALPGPAGFNGRSADDDAVPDPDSLSPTCALPLRIDTDGDLPYSEASRRYRRTVYRHDDWLTHRSSTRLFGNLSGTLTSGVVRSLLTEVAAVATIATFTCAWNASLLGPVDFRDVARDPLFPTLPRFLLMQLPALPFTLASPALGLLLVFRTNASYARWVESRVAWGRVVSHCRNVMRQSSLWLNVDREPFVVAGSPEVRSVVHWSPYDRVGVVNAVP
jgi:hypothetical protein